jgi:hypothetical protein
MDTCPLNILCLKKSFIEKIPKMIYVKQYAIKKAEKHKRKESSISAPAKT